MAATANLFPRPLKSNICGPRFLVGTMFHTKDLRCG
jgi:hypothetical protein